MWFVFLILFVLFSLASSQTCENGSCSNDSNQLVSSPMTFVFTESFHVNGLWNGRTYREIRGLSGTHGASIYLAEGLAAHGHRVLYIADSVEGGVHKDVEYVNAEEVAEIHCDFFITTFNLIDLKLLERFIFKFKKIGIILNNDPSEVNIMAPLFLKLPRSQIIFLHVSNFEMWNVMDICPWVMSYENHLLHNSIDIEEIPYPIDLTIKQKHFVFFPCFERGGLVSFQVTKHFPDFKFITMNYGLHNTVDYHRSKLGEDPFHQIVLANVSKNGVYDTLQRSKYFVYPLISLADNNIHYDTFAYVVLEALLHGVVVIAPRMGCYEELFGEAIAYVEVSDVLAKEDIYQWRKALPVLGSELMCSRYVSMVERLEADESLYQTYVTRGLALREKFDNRKIAAEFVDYAFETLTRQQSLEAQQHQHSPSWPSSFEQFVPQRSLLGDLD